MTPRNLQIVVCGLRLLWRYRFRSTLLMLSAALGVGGVVCSVNYGTGGSRQILDQIRRIDVQLLPVMGPRVASRVTGAHPVGSTTSAHVAIGGKADIPPQVRR